MRVFRAVAAKLALAIGCSCCWVACDQWAVGRVAGRAEVWRILTLATSAALPWPCLTAIEVNTSCLSPLKKNVKACTWYMVHGTWYVCEISVEDKRQVCELGGRERRMPSHYVRHTFIIRRGREESPGQGATPNRGFWRYSAAHSSTIPPIPYHTIPYHTNHTNHTCTVLQRARAVMLCPYRAATHAKKREPMYTGSAPSTAPSTEPVALVLDDDGGGCALACCELPLVAAPPPPLPAVRWWGLDRPVKVADRSRAKSGGRGVPEVMTPFKRSRYAWMREGEREREREREKEKERGGAISNRVKKLRCGVG